MFWTLDLIKQMSLCGNLVGTNTAIMNLSLLGAQSQMLESSEVMTRRDFMPVFCSRPGNEVAFITERNINLKCHTCAASISLRHKHTNPSLPEAVETAVMWVRLHGSHSFNIAVIFPPHGGVFQTKQPKSWLMEEKEYFGKFFPCCCHRTSCLMPLLSVHR